MFQNAQSGYSFFGNKLKWHPQIFLSKSNWQLPKTSVENVAPLLKRLKKKHGN
jgi:hypothetical protein